MAQQLKNGLAAERAVQDRRITYRQFLDWDGENQHVEWVDGKVVEMAPVSSEHQDLGGFLIGVLRAYVEAHDLGVIRYEPFQMKSGPDLPGRSPDIMFVAKRNLRRIKENHLEGPADLAVEIISPGSRAVDRGDKHYEYERGGVREYWLLDPQREQAEFYILGRDRYFHPTQVGEDHIFRSAVIKGLWVNVDWLWDRPRPSITRVLKEWKLI